MSHRHIFENFDWAETRGKKLVIFMPNYMWANLTEFSINQIQTRVDPEDYLIIVGNDNVDTDWSHLWDKRVRYFTIFREDTGPRNSCFVRNYAIKRCLGCEKFLNKDGEVVLIGDFISNIIDSPKSWRPGIIYVLDETQTKNLLLATSVEEILPAFPVTKYIELLESENSYVVKEIIEQADGRVNPSTYYHYAYSTDHEVLYKIRGYDEDYITYGWEDSDMFIRLFHLGYHIIPDYNCAAIHPWHFRRADTAEEVEANMRDIFVSKSPADYFRNLGSWGDGYRNA